MKTITLSAVAFAAFASSYHLPRAVGNSTGSGKTMIGVNIAGCDFGVQTDGTIQGGPSCPPENYEGQMQHFAKDDGMTIFRLPVGWQFLTDNQLTGELCPKVSGYDSLVKACLATNAYCILDLHMYARFNGALVSSSDLSSLWTKLATRYKSFQGAERLIYGIMNEPHDLDINTWAKAVQDSVTAIRKAGATSNMMLIPGTQWTSASGFQDQSAPALSTVVDTDGSTSKLIYDIHQYFDNGSGGKTKECASDDKISSAFQPLADYLDRMGRKAFLSETGGGNSDSCYKTVCSALKFLKDNPKVYMGWTGWAAGGFPQSYELVETPKPDGSDQPIVSQCIAGRF